MSQKKRSKEKRCPRQSSIADVKRAGIFRPAIHRSVGKRRASMPAALRVSAGPSGFKRLWINSKARSTASRGGTLARHPCGDVLERVNAVDRHPRAGGDPETPGGEEVVTSASMDSRLRGNDGLGRGSGA